MSLGWCERPKCVQLRILGGEAACGFVVMDEPPGCGKRQSKHTHGNSYAHCDATLTTRMAFLSLSLERGKSLPAASFTVKS